MPEEDIHNQQQNPDAVNHPVLDEELRALDEYNKDRSANNFEYLVGVILKKLDHPEETDRQLAYAKVQDELKDLDVDISQPNLMEHVRKLLLNLPDGARLLIERISKNPHYGAEPISLFNGEFVHEVEDLRINGAGIDFTFKRIYRNQVTFNGRMGYNWDHCYNLWLRLSPDNTVIFRNNGFSFRQESYVKHPKFDQEGFKYYVPQDGQHGIIIENGDDSLIWRSPAGDRYIYERDPGINTRDFLFRIKRIQDKNGQISDNDHSNYLDFIYSSDSNNNSLLQFIKINNENRVVEFYYDEQARIKTIEDYFTIDIEHRKWHYNYDDFGDLVAVTTPKTDRYPYGLTTCYEYSSSQFSLVELQHNLTRIIDPASQMYLENEYSSDEGLLNFNRVIRQRQGNGETYFDYQDIIQEFDRDYSEIEKPVHQTNVTERNGHLVHYVYNVFGNLLLKEEKILRDGFLRLIRWRYRYNEDGALVAVRTPEGRIMQYYYGRENYLKNNPDSFLDNLTYVERMAFGNLLSIVKRGKFYNFSPADLDLSDGVWGNFFPDITIRNIDPSSGDLLDIFTRFTYERDYQQPLSLSDPRFTKSAVPHSSLDDEEFRETLTRYQYIGRPPNPATGDPGDSTKLWLSAVIYPDVHRADGSILADIRQSYTLYDDKGRQLESIDSEGIVTRTEYFPGVTSSPNDPSLVKEGYLKKKIVDPDGIALTIEYEVNEVGITTANIFPNAVGAPPGYFRTAFHVNSLNQVTRTLTSPPYFYETRLFYDRNGQTERIERDLRDESGKDLWGGTEVKDYIHDDQNNLVRESHGGLDLSTHLITHYKYNESDKLVLTILPKKNSTKMDYDESLLNTGITRGFGSQEASTTHTEYDDDGLKKKSIDGNRNISHFIYDPFGRLVEIIDPMGNKSSIDYDKSGNILNKRFFEIQYDGTFKLLYKIEYEYDELNHRISVRKYQFKIPSNAITIEDQYFYDRKGRLTRFINGKLQETSYSYDVTDRKTFESDNKGNYTQFEYDANGNLIRRDTHEKVKDPVTGQIREDIFSTLYAYDSLNRLACTTDSLGNVNKFSYDSRNNVVKQVDALGNVMRFEYDVYGHKIATISELTITGLGGGIVLPSIITRVEYDKNGNVSAYTDGNSNRSEQEFDSLDRRIIFRYADQSIQEFRYDENDNIILIKDNNGVKRLFGFNKLNHMIRMDLDISELRGPTPPEGASFEEFNYDGLGRITLERNNYVNIIRKVDSLGNNYEEIITFDTPEDSLLGSFTIKRNFDVLGNITQLTYPNGRAIQYDLDSLNRIQGIKNIVKGSDYRGSANFPESYQILLNQYRGLRLAKSILGNGTSTELASDKEGRTIEVKHLGPDSSNIFTIQQLFDGAGNIRFRNSITRPTGLKRESYQYNSVYWITNVQETTVRSLFDASEFEPFSAPQLPSMLIGQRQTDAVIGSLEQDPISFTYSYDFAENRNEVKYPGRPAISYTPNNLNQYKAVGIDSLSYDLNGNLISDQQFSYFYDYQNRLTRIYDNSSGQNRARFFYDTEGRRLLTLKPDLRIHFIHDGNNVIEEYSNGSLFAQYVNRFGLDTVCQLTVEGDEYWYHKDLDQSTRVMTNSVGTISANYQYDLFGKFLVHTGPYNPYCYKSRLLDIEDPNSSLYSFRSRHYSTYLGRFLQRDSVFHGDRYNLYTAFGNNPLIFSDPLGEEKTLSTTSQSEQTPQGNQPGPEDYEKFKLIKTPILPFLFGPAHVGPYLRDQSVGINDPLLRLHARMGQQNSLNVAASTQLTEVIGAGIVGTGYAGVLIGSAAAGGAGIAYPAVSNLAFESSISISIRYPVLTTVGIAYLRSETWTPEPASAVTNTLQHAFRGKAGERGIGMLYVDVEKISHTELEETIAFVRDMDFQAGFNGLVRQTVGPASRKIADRVAEIGRQLLGLGTLKAAGHTPDVAGGGNPIGIIIGIPKGVNLSIGGQWKRYKPGFVFEGISLFEKGTGKPLYYSMGLEHFTQILP